MDNTTSDSITFYLSIPHCFNENHAFSFFSESLQPPPGVWQKYLLIEDNRGQSSGKPTWESVLRLIDVIIWSNNIENA